MPEFFDGLVGAGNYYGIKSKNKTSQCSHNRPAQEFVLIHKQSCVNKDRKDKLNQLCRSLQIFRRINLHAHIIHHYHAERNAIF